VRSKRGTKRQGEDRSCEEVIVSSTAGTKPRKRSERTAGDADVFVWADDDAVWKMQYKGVENKMPC